MPETLLNQNRAVQISYGNCKRGDTFLPAPVVFKINGVEEDFSGWTLKGQLKKDGVVTAELNITVTGGSVQYMIAADIMAAMETGVHVYDVQKTQAPIVKTIQEGKIYIPEDVTI